MKYFIKRNPMAKHGYDFVVESDDGQQTNMSIDKITPDGKSYVLPDNPSGRRYWALSKVTADVNEIPAKGNEKIIHDKQPKRTLMELGNLLTDEKDKAKWQELVKKIERTELIAKAQAEYERSKAAYEALLNGGNK